MPGWLRDDIRNTMAFFSSKIYFDLNAQCIVDDHKKLIWVSYPYKDGSHDSSYLKDTTLYKILEIIRDDLYRLGYYILWDSAYTIDSFMLPLYDSP